MKNSAGNPTIRPYRHPLTPLPIAPRDTLPTALGQG